jgi:hypothetical protein
MTAHTPHPPSHEVGLQLDCPRCKELAANPTAKLDDENLRRIWTGKHHTRLDLAAYDKLYATVVASERLARAFGFDPVPLFRVGGRA